MLQYVLEAPFSLDFGFLMGDETAAPAAHTEMREQGFEDAYNRHSNRFEHDFAEKIGAKLPKEQIRFAQYSMSAVLGGIGYWSGSSLERSEGRDKPIQGQQGALFSAVPCRPFFPRGK